MWTFYSSDHIENENITTLWDTLEVKIMKLDIDLQRPTNDLEMNFDLFT